VFAVGLCENLLVAGICGQIAGPEDIMAGGL
jgi:hypothetical protein